MSVQIIATGLKDMLEYVQAVPELAEEAQALAVNDTARDEEVAIRRDMEAQINFPKGYLSGERYGIRRRATRQLAEAVISGRDRPTSLARFAGGANVANSRGRPIFVRVKSGQTAKLDRAFLIELRNGNVGLAIRLPEGQEPDKAYKPVQLTRRGGQLEPIWLLYGPSVDQVLRGVSADRAPQIAERLQRNFLRQFSRISSRG